MAEPVPRVREITGGRGVDTVVDTTSTTRPDAVLLAIDVAVRKGGRLVLQGQAGKIPDFPIDLLTRKYITVKAARGHCYSAVELALQRIDSGKYPIEAMATHTFDLAHVDTAIRATGGEGVQGAIHVTVLPWQ